MTTPDRKLFFLKRIVHVSSAFVIAGFLGGCVDMPVEVPYTPDALVIDDMSLEQALAVLKTAKGTLCFSAVVCGGFNPDLSGIELSADRQSFVLVEANGDRSHTVPVSGTVIKTKTMQNYQMAWVYFRDDLYVAFDDQKDAKSVADALTTIQSGSTHHDGSDFAATAKAYREAAVKPVIGEEVRRFQVHAQAAIRENRLDDAEQAYGHALRLAPWWPAGHFNRALILAELGRYSTACREMKKYLDLVPNAQDARSAQDKIYEWEIKVPRI